MITLRELEYVNGWARRVPYPGIDYAEKTAEKLVNAYYDFIQFYKDKKYDIITSQVSKYYLKYWIRIYVIC